MNKLYILFIMLLLESVKSQVPSSADCVSPCGKIRFLLQSNRNKTGYRHIKVLLQKLHNGEMATDIGSFETTQEISTREGVEMFSTTTLITIPPEGIRVPHGYEFFPGSGYYKMHPETVTWDEANLICQREGAYLMIVNSDIEANVAKQFLNRKYTIKDATWNSWAWSGFHDRGKEGEYNTIFGTAVAQSGYNKWLPGQPSNKPWGIEPDRDCGTIDTKALLADSPCLAKLPFICEHS